MPANEGTAPEEDDLVLFAERGASWWPVAVGPLLALAGALAESAAPGGAAWGLWVVVAVVVGGVTAIVVVGRRRFLRVVLTPQVLVQGSTALPVADIARVVPDDGSGAYGIRVLGDGPVVPRRYDGIVLTLDDGVQRVAWARDGEGLRRALRAVVGAREPEPTGAEEARDGPERAPEALGETEDR